MLRAEDIARVPRTRWVPYVLLAEEIRRLSSSPKEDAQESLPPDVLQRADLDTTIIRATTVIAPGADWKLSPAYDLTPLSRSAPSGATLPWPAAIMDAGRMRKTCFRMRPLSFGARRGASDRRDDGSAGAGALGTRCPQPGRQRNRLRDDQLGLRLSGIDLKPAETAR